MASQLSIRWAMAGYVLCGEAGEDEIENDSWPVAHLAEGPTVKRLAVLHCLQDNQLTL